MKQQWLVIVLLCCSGAASAQTQEAKLIASDGRSYDYFGWTVSIDGDTAVVGAYADDDAGSESGSAYVFTRDAAGTWSQQAKLTASDAAAEDRFGWAVAVSGDTAVIGAHQNDDAGLNSGSAYVFVRDAGGTWSEQAKLTASDAAANDWFSYYAVWIDGDTAVIGAINNEPGGAAYVFTRDAGGTWSEQAKLTASDAAFGDWFGSFVSIDGDTAVIGAHANDDHGSGSGSVYVFTRDAGGTWTEQAKLTASDAAASDWFGYWVSVSGDTTVIGAYQNADAGLRSGSAYVFTRDGGGTWTEQAKLTASDAAENDQYSRSAVSVDGDTIVIGARYDDDGGTNTGSVYVYTRDAGGVWREQTKLHPADAFIGDSFGSSVWLDGNTVVSGAIADDDRGTSSGSAYIFTLCHQALPLVTDEWKMISLPCAPSATVEELFGDDGLGDYGTDWAIVTREESTDSYHMLQLTDNIEQGAGYWIKVLSDSPVIDVFGGPSDDSSDFEVALVDDTDPGRYNMVGNPFTAAVSWGDVKVVDSGTSIEYAISESDSGNYITNRTMFTWNGTSYQSFNPVSNPGTITTFDGFWVRVKAPASLRFPPPGAKKSAARAGKMQIPGWWLQLIVSSGEYSDPGNRLGRMTVSLDGGDEYDLEELAPYASPYLTLVFPHPEWGSYFWSHTTDFRELRPGAGGTWDLEVRSDIPRDVVLSWQGESGSMPELLARSVLVDVESSQTITPQPDGSYAFTMAAATHRLRWQINSLPQLDAGPDRQTYVGRLLVFGLPFTDEDSGDTHTATIDWDDGVIEAASVDPSTRHVSASHQFTAAGTYEVELCVSDSAGAVTCDTFAVEVDQSPPVIFEDSFESGDTSQWSSGG
jgi:hypothetical protein